jgi:NAD(P)-dependent dehydrogenase (short-subunit alcohol dehydrogenase family)
MARLAGKRAVVTDAGQGLGRGAAIAFMTGQLVVEGGQAL